MTTDELIGKTLQFEGGYVNDPDDAGGETNFGISKKQYPNVNIKNLTKQDAINIYKRDYFDRMNLSAIVNENVAWKLFDIGVNMGTGTAVRFAQQIVGEKEDGILGGMTASFINSQDPNTFLRQLVKKQLNRYADIVAKNPSQSKFFKGWVNRALEY